MKTEGSQRKTALVLWCVLNFPVLLAAAWIIGTHSFAVWADLGGLSFVLLGWLGFRAAEDMPNYSVLRGTFLASLLGFVTSLIWAIVVIGVVEHTGGSRRADFVYLFAPVVNALLFPVSYLIHRQYLATDAVVRRRLRNEAKLKSKKATAEARRARTGMSGALARNRWVVGGALLLAAVGCLASSSDVRDAIFSVAPPAPTKKWELDTGKFTRSHYLFPFSQRTPAIDEQGTIYAVGKAGVFAVTPDGGVKWAYPQSSCISPVLSDDDSVWADGCSDDVRFGGIMRINPDGSPSKQGIGLGAVTQIAVGYDGTVYMGTVREGMVAITPDPSMISSRVKWRHPGEGFVLDENNKVYANSPAGLVKYSSDGVTEWGSQTGDCAPPALGSDGSIYNVCDGLEVFNPDGVSKWVYHAPDATASPAIAQDGTVYFGDDHGVLHAIGPDGQLKWKFTTSDFSRKLGSVRLIPSYAVAYLIQMLSPKNIPPHYSVADERPKVQERVQIRSTPTIARNGTVYFGSANHNLYAVGGDGKLKWVFKTGGEVYSPTIAPDGTIYVQSEDGKLYAIKESEANGGLWGQWPKLGSGLRNTARGSR